MGCWQVESTVDARRAVGNKFLFYQHCIENKLPIIPTLSMLQTIGWDIALTDEGIFIVEANTAYDAASFQLFEKRGMRKEFRK
jgi:hypothetical protein